MSNQPADGNALFDASLTIPHRFFIGTLPLVANIARESILGQKSDNDLLMSLNRLVGTDLGYANPFSIDMLSSFPSSGLTPSIRSLGLRYEKHLMNAGEIRKHSGSFFTPEPIIDSILDHVDHAIDESSLICDPAMGCGFFLLRIAERVIDRCGGDKEKAAAFAGRCLIGVDIDPVAVTLTRIGLWLLLSTERCEFFPDHERIAVGDSLLGDAWTTASVTPTPGFSWKNHFPGAAAKGGFDVIVGNPPYDVLTNFSRHPNKKAYAGRLKASGDYVHSLKGQVNLYRCFIERSLALLRPGGLLSFVVPATLTLDRAAGPLRRELLERHAARHWHVYGEEDRVFSGATQAVCVFAASKDAGPANEVIVEKSAIRTRVPLSFIQRLRPDDMALLVVNRDSMDLLEWLVGNVTGKIGDVVNAYVGEVDQTVFRDCMRDDPTDCVLLRGCHIKPFSVDVEPIPGKERFLDLPKFLCMKGASAKRIRDRASVSRVVQLGIRNMRTRPRLVAAIAPAGVYAGNSVNVYEPIGGLSREFVAGLLNSSFLEWLFHISSGNNNINLHEIIALPFPVPEKVNNHLIVKIENAYCRGVATAKNGKIPKSVQVSLDEAVEELYRLPHRMRGLGKVDTGQ